MIRSCSVNYTSNEHYWGIGTPGVVEEWLISFLLFPPKFVFFSIMVLFFHNFRPLFACFAGYASK